MTEKNPLTVEFLSLIMKFCESMYAELDLLERSGYKLCDPCLCHLAYSFIEESSNECDILDIFIIKTKSFWSEVNGAKREFFIDNASGYMVGMDAEFIELLRNIFSTVDETGKYFIDDNKLGEYIKISKDIVIKCTEYIEERRSVDATYHEDIHIGSVVRSMIG